MTARRSARAEELLDQAMRLFAERGYGATSVADIQQAVGMQPGSGALYKHFPSKEALLAAGIGQFVDEVRISPVELPKLEAARLRPTLRTVALAILDRLSTNDEGFRIAWRDLGQFPELRRRVLDHRIQLGFDLVTGWLQQGVDDGEIEVDDPAATSAVLLGSLVYFRMMALLLGEPPAAASGVDDRRFVDAWVEVALGALHGSDRGPEPPAPA
jgi:AcrR family transcriptional regulator